MCPCRKVPIPDIRQKSRSPGQLPGTGPASCGAQCPVYALYRSACGVELINTPWPSTGTRLGPYEILGPIGAGGMGAVYLGHDTRLGRQVAIKVSAQEFSERFERVGICSVNLILSERRERID